MRVPNAERAIIAPEKVRDYLLNPNHRRGGSKARFFLSIGYLREFWQQLESDLRRQHLIQEVDRVVLTEFGIRYEIHGRIVAPNGRATLVRSIW